MNSTFRNKYKSIFVNIDFSNYSKNGKQLYVEKILETIILCNSCK